MKPCFSLCMHILLITLPNPHLNVTGQLLNDLGCDLISPVSIIKRAATPEFLKPQSTSDGAFLRTSDKIISVTKIVFNSYCPLFSGNLVLMLAGNWVLIVQCWVCAKVWDAVNAIAQMRAEYEPKVDGQGNSEHWRISKNGANFTTAACSPKCVQTWGMFVGLQGLDLWSLFFDLGLNFPHA